MLRYTTTDSPIYVRVEAEERKERIMRRTLSGRLGISWAGGRDKGQQRMTSSIWINVLIGLSTVVVVATGQQQQQMMTTTATGADSIGGGGGGQTGQ